MHETVTLELAEIATSGMPLHDRAQQALAGLRRVTGFDAAWVALVDPADGTYRSLAATDLDSGTQQYLSGPKMARDADTTVADCVGEPVSVSDLPYPAEELSTWAESLLPGGFRETLAVALFTKDQRHVGFLALLYVGSRPPRPATRWLLHQLTPALAVALDPVRSLAMAALVLEGARAGVVLSRDGDALPLPGLRGDVLLGAGSPVTVLSREFLKAGQAFTSFLWPGGGGPTPEEHVRVTVLASPREAPDGLLGAVVLAPATDLRGLTTRELEVLGLVIEGLSNQQIAHRLVVSPRTVATHLEHILAKLDAQTRTLAAVRAERQGLYVPSSAMVPGSA